MAEATPLQLTLADLAEALQIFLLQRDWVHLDKVLLAAMADMVVLVLAVVLVLLVVQQLVVLEYYGPIQIVIMAAAAVLQVTRSDLSLEVLAAADRVLNILDVFLLQQVLQALVAEVGQEVT
jgi:hypothetical protein